MNVLRQSTGSATTMRNLNDDCLQEVFEFFDLREMTVIADVCVRFRRNAVLAARLRSENVLLNVRSPAYQYSKLRHFGGSIRRISVDGTTFSEKVRPKLQKRLIQLMIQYYNGKEIELELIDYDITDEVVFLMMPLLARVRKLAFTDCKRGEVLKNMSFLAPELSELRYFNYLDRYSCEKVLFKSLDQKFPKLKFISFWHVDYLKETDIVAFLMQNSQLKKIVIKFCKVLADGIFQLIADFVPGIEAIDFRTANRTNERTIKYFGQLHALKSLTLGTIRDDSYVQSVIHELASENILVESLHLTDFNLRYKTQLFIEGISKMKNLKTLRLHKVTNFTATHLIEICKDLKELSEIFLGEIDLKITEDDLLKFIRNAERLQIFEFDYYHHVREIDSPFLNGNTFNELRKIVDQRRERLKLKLTVRLKNPDFTMHVPAELIRSSSCSLIAVNVIYT